MSRRSQIALLQPIASRLQLVFVFVLAIAHGVSRAERVDEQKERDVPLKFTRSGCDDKIVRVWDTQNGDEIASLTGHSGALMAVAVSTDGRLLATGGIGVPRAASIHLWNLQERTLIAKLQGHRSWISALVFTPDSQLLNSASLDATVRIWDVSQAIPASK